MRNSIMMHTVKFDFRMLYTFLIIPLFVLNIGQNLTKFCDIETFTCISQAQFWSDDFFFNGNAFPRGDNSQKYYRCDIFYIINVHVSSVMGASTHTWISQPQFCSDKKIVYFFLKRRAFPTGDDFQKKKLLFELYPCEYEKAFSSINSPIFQIFCQKLVCILYTCSPTWC